MREEHPSFTQPNDKSIKIWRYMDLARFLSFLQEEHIYFARADKLGDPFEGSTPLANRLHDQLLRDAIKDPNNRGKYPDLDPFFDLGEGHLEQMLSQMSDLAKNSLRTLFVSCWHMNEHESAAMWSQYGTNSSVCIQTTYQALADCLPDPVFIGVVNYIDYNTQAIFQGNGFNNIMHKRKSFEHEREVRAIHWSFHAPKKGDTTYARIDGESGIKLKINLHDLVQRIYISPTAPIWFSPLIKSLLDKYGLDKPLFGSELSAKPLY